MSKDVNDYQRKKDVNDYQRKRDLGILAQESAPTRLASLLEVIGIDADKEKEIGAGYGKIRATLSNKYLMLSFDEAIGYCMSILAYQERRIQALEEEAKKT